MKLKFFKFELFVFLVILIGLGCARLGIGPTKHPNAINTFDSVTADQLYLAQVVLEGLNADAPSKFPKAIPALQVATRDYNTAQNVYFLWRCAVAGATTIGSTNVACPVPAANKTTQANVQTALDTSTQSLATAQKVAVAK